MKRIVSVLFLLIFAAVTFAQEVSSEDIDGWALSVLSSLGENTKSILEALGKPERHEVKKEENKHGYGMDTIDTLYYEGLKIAAMSAEDGSWSHVFFIESDSSKYDFKGFSMGENVDNLVKKLGNPELKTESEINYETDFTDVTLKTQNGKVTSVKISMFPD